MAVGARVGTPTGSAQPSVDVKRTTGAGASGHVPATLPRPLVLLGPWSQAAPATSQVVIWVRA